MKDHSYSPKMIAANDEIVFLLMEDMKSILLPKIGQEGKMISVEYPLLWEIVQVENLNETLIFLHIDWPDKDEPLRIHFKKEQWKFLPEIKKRGIIGLMFDFDPVHGDTSGLLLLNHADRGLDYIIQEMGLPS
jgi:hypothetical protein